VKNGKTNSDISGRCLQQGEHGLQYHVACVYFLKVLEVDFMDILQDELLATTTKGC
jgi:hypothetical protein